MKRVTLSYQLAPSRSPSHWLSNPLMDLLQRLREQGSIAAAARCMGFSYRHVWGQLKTWEAELGQPLVHWERGQAARLTPFAERLLWAERLAQARLAPQIESLQAALEQTLALAFDPSSHVLSLYASHDDALPQLQQHAAEYARLHLDMRFCGSVDALRALNEGRCAVAGFHVRVRPARDSLSARTYRPLLRPGQHKLMGFAQRWQGLMQRAEEPLLRDLRAVVALKKRFANRALGSGTRLLLDELLAEEGLSPGELIGHDQDQASHAAVAQCVLSGQADVGLGTASTAHRFGLVFVPLAEEHYHLACLKSALDQPALLALRNCLASSAWQQHLSAMSGYSPHKSGEVQAMNQHLPWWNFRHA